MWLAGWLVLGFGWVWFVVLDVDTHCKMWIADARSSIFTLSLETFGPSPIRICSFGANF